MINKYSIYVKESLESSIKEIHPQFQCKEIHRFIKNPNFIGYDSKYNLSDHMIYILWLDNPALYQSKGISSSRKFSIKICRWLWYLYKQKQIDFEKLIVDLRKVFGVMISPEKLFKSSSFVKILALIFHHLNNDYQLRNSQESVIFWILTMQAYEKNPSILQTKKDKLYKNKRYMVYKNYEYVEKHLTRSHYPKMAARYLSDLRLSIHENKQCIGCWRNYFKDKYIKVDIKNTQDFIQNCKTNDWECTGSGAKGVWMIYKAHRYSKKKKSERCKWKICRGCALLYCSEYCQKRDWNLNKHSFVCSKLGSFLKKGKSKKDP